MGCAVNKKLASPAVTLVGRTTTLSRPEWLHCLVYLRAGVRPGSTSRLLVYSSQRRVSRSGVIVLVHTWGNPRACERERFAPVACPRARCPRSQEKCEHYISPWRGACGNPVSPRPRPAEEWGNPVPPSPRPREGLGGLRPPRNNFTFIAAWCGGAVWTAEVTIVRRVQPPSQPPPAGGRSRVPAPSGGGSGRGWARTRRFQRRRAPEPWSRGVRGEACRTFRHTREQSLPVKVCYDNATRKPAPPFGFPVSRGRGKPGFPWYVIPSGIGNPAWSCSSPQLDSSTQGFGELESCGGVELSQCDAIK